mgnify:CR=1 FL=1
MKCNKIGFHVDLEPFVEWNEKSEIGWKWEW